ncbi:MAG TPA: hypothetical protein VHX16_02100, partial [Chloroflexota bacterium]|nr:hypothetical protein [Chloroflexota bacterium]
MFYPWGYPPALVARRFLARAARRLILNPTTMLLTTALVAFWIVGGPASLTVNTAPPADTTDQAAEGYMRALRDRDSAQLFKILSP